LYEAFFAGCIPVILSDDFRLPFEDQLEWTLFSVKWPMSDVSLALYDFLATRDHREVHRMKTAVDAHACWFDYHQKLELPGWQCSPYKGLVTALERRSPALTKSLPRYWRHEEGAWGPGAS